MVGLDNQPKHVARHVLTEAYPLKPLSGSVADPWHFWVDPDPDPRIYASD